MTLASSSAVLAQAGGQTPIYLDPKRPVEERIDDLMSRMTLKEKVGQLNLPCLYVEELGRSIPAKMVACRKFAAGTYTQEIGPACGFFTLANQILHEGARQQAEYFNELQKIALTQTRLKIPVMEDEEGTHGAMFPGATVFPEGLAVGSSFDLDLVNAIYAAAAAEARAVGIHMLSTLVMEVDRDPRMGRNEEAYTEDPYLYMRIGETIVRATQGSDISAPDKVIAVLTDFPTQSEPSSGLERGAIEVSDRSLRENFMPPWIGAITKAGGLGVMAGYPEIEDVPAHASVKWMNDVLRQEIGFKGIVESEGGGFGTLLYENIVPTQKEAGLLALRAGVDLDITYEPAYMGPLVESVEEGRVPMALVDRALRRVLEQKFRLGLFENPYVDVDHAVQVLHSQANQDLALRAGREGIVLLKNDQNLLPLKKDLKAVAVIGPNADDVMNQLGDYSPNVLQHVTTVIEGIKAVVSPQTKVTPARGCEITGTDKSGFAKAVEAAKGADVAIVVVGESQHDSPTDGESHDVASLDLSGVQEDLIQAVFETGTPTVVVLINGRPLSTRWTSEHVPALVEAWEPGERGGEAVADVLFGNYNPTGRLAISVPRHSGQLPIYYNYKPSKAQWMRNSYADSYVDMPATPLYLSLAKNSSSPKSLGFQDVSRNPLPHDSLAECPVRSCCSRAEFPPQLAAGEPGSAPPTAGPEPGFQLRHQRRDQRRKPRRPRRSGPGNRHKACRVSCLPTGVRTVPKTVPNCVLGEYCAMTTNLKDLTTTQLHRIIAIKEQIETARRRCEGFRTNPIIVPEDREIHGSKADKKGPVE
jgi:beta-glucosidase